jgi:stress responsive alpha/beta barrel protein
MIRHVVLFTWKPEATPAELARVATELASLPGQIPQVEAYHFGADAGLAEGNADFAITADFDDADAYLVYRNDPVHQQVIQQVINPIVATRVSAQFEF